MQVLLLALEAAVYPTLIAATFVLLTQPRPRRLLATYLFAGIAISIAAGLAIVYGLHGAKVVQSPGSGPSWIADVVMGVLALLAAAALWWHLDERVRRRRGKPAEPAATSADDPWSQRILARGSVPIVIVAALLLNLPGAAYLIGLKDIAAGGHSTGTVVALVVAFNVIMFAFAEVPLAGLMFAPERTTELVGRFNNWLMSHGREVAAVLLAIFGVYLVVKGISSA